MSIMIIIILIIMRVFLERLCMLNKCTYKNTKFMHINTQNNMCPSKHAQTSNKVQCSKGGSKKKVPIKRKYCINVHVK